jgi:catechol 2,3-dioxygenase-like lactoylglutathione lyase family enzyme
VTVLGLEPVSRPSPRAVAFRCGDGVLLVFDPAKTSAHDPESPARAPAHGARGPGHVAFAVSDRDLPAWRGHLAANRVEVEAEVDWPEGGTSLYFRDPAGNSVELAPPTLWGGRNDRGAKPPREDRA